MTGYRDCFSSYRLEGLALCLCRYRKGMGQIFSPGDTVIFVVNTSSNSTRLCVSVITVNLFGNPLAERQDEQQYSVKSKQHDLRTRLSDKQ